MIEQLRGIVIEVVKGQVLYAGEVVKEFHTETVADFTAQAKAYINSHHTPEHNPLLWEARYR
jgi:hypoxanthine-guanine phosphoribosyltransferase